LRHRRDAYLSTFVSFGSHLPAIQPHKVTLNIFIKIKDGAMNQS